MNRVDRLMGYLLLFQSRGLMRAQDFADKFEISERTVYRDIQALSEVGVPIMAMPGEGYRLMEGYYLPPITFSPDEARSLYLAVSMLTGQTTPGSTQSAALSALEKIRAVLPNVTLRQVEALEAITHFYSFPHTLLDFDDEIFLTLQQAIYERQLVRLRYHARHNNQVTERDVEPLELVNVEKTWMLVAYCRLRQDQRVFRLNRIDDMAILNERFTRRELANYRRTPYKVIEVIVRFDPSTVRWVRERQHFTFDKNYKDNTMLYKPYTFEQIEWWLLSWGDKLEVLEPIELRERLAKTATQIAKRHQTGDVD